MVTFWITYTSSFFSHEKAMKLQKTYEFTHENGFMGIYEAITYENIGHMKML